MGISANQLWIKYNNTWISGAKKWTNSKNYNKNHIQKRNIIVTDTWSEFFLLNNPAYGFFHNTYNHEGGNFGEGLDLTSRTESFRSKLKNKLKKFMIVFRD